MKLIILFTLIINCANSICQTKISTYYKNVNNAIEYFDNQEYENSLSELKKCSSDFMFDYDKRFYYRCLDSLLSKHPRFDALEYQQFALELKSKSKGELPVGLLSQNKTIDTGFNQELLESKDKYEIHRNEAYLLSIINTDRFISLIRTNGFSETTVDSIYNLFAQNVLAIFKQDSLPCRTDSYSWNDNLFLAISHALRSLDFKQGNILLDYLWSHVKSGNLHAFQFAQYYDDVYYRGYGYSILGVKTVVDSFDPKTNSVVQKAVPIKNIDNTNKLRKQYFLGDLEEWYKFKNIKYDFNINR